MKVLITGITGFIGSHLSKKLIELGYEVYGFARYSSSHGLKTSVPILYGDVSLYSSVELTVEKVRPDAIIHLAAIATRSDYNYDNFEDVLRTNLIGSANLAEAARKRVPKLECFMLASSCDVYGVHESFPLTEEAELKPTCPYTIGKISSELYLRYMNKTWNFPGIILRPFNTYGVIKRRTVVESIIDQMLKGEKVKLIDPKPIRDFLFVTDHVDAYVACLQNYEKILGETLNFCTGQGTSVSELANMAKRIIGFGGDVVWGSGPKRINDIPCLIGSYEKAKRLLGWTPKVILEEGIKMIVNEWRQ
jgi:nucleoside-diphosphate-sugar epimerase